MFTSDGASTSDGPVGVFNLDATPNFLNGTTSIPEKRQWVGWEYRQGWLKTDPSVGRYLMLLAGSQRGYSTISEYLAVCEFARYRRWSRFL